MSRHHPHPTTSELYTDDQDLLNRLIDNDQYAFFLLYSRYSPRIKSYLQRRLWRSDLVDEVLNDVMMVLWQKASSCPEKVPLLAWLFGIARLKSYRALALAAGVEVVTAEAWGVDEEDPEEGLLKHEQQFILQRAISQLPPDESQVLTRFIFQGHSHREIAAQLDLPVNTVKTRLRRARHHLQTRVEMLNQNAANRS